MKYNIVIVGVGGQGTLLASKILGGIALSQGLDVKVSEIHGMAQRGGSVSTQVRFGDAVYSPIIGNGEADIMVAFEKMEALRYLKLLKPDGKLIVNDLAMPSAPVQAGTIAYPTNTIEVLEGYVNTTVLPASEIAAELGNEKVANIVLFGALAKMLDIPNIDWKDILASTVKEQFVDVNMQAFDRGAAFIEG